MHRPKSSSGPFVSASYVAADDRGQVSQRLRVVLRSILVASLIVIPFGWFQSNPQALWTALAGAISASACLLFNRLGRTEAAVVLLLAAMLVGITVSMISGAGIHDSTMVLYPTILVVGGMLLQPRPYVVLVALVIASVVLVHWLSSTGQVAPQYVHETDVTDLVGIVSILVIQAIALALLARGLYRNLRDARRESSERRIAEEQVRRLNTELEHRVERRTEELASANRDLEAFSYSVSHDLRTPVRVVGSYLDILAEEHSAAWDPAARELFDRIRASIERMGRLVDELLEFSRLGRREIVRSRVGMDALVRTVVDSLRASSPGRDVCWILHPLPDAWGDPLLLEQVWENLIGNAFKYTARSDRARIEIGHVGGSEGSGWFVSDNGIGFDMARADRLFDVFERLHDDGGFEGDGIGLAIVHRILTRHGGSIHAWSQPGHGALFRFELPAADVAAASASTAAVDSR